MNTELHRQDTPGLDGKIFMNSAGSSLMPRPVIKSMNAYLALEEEHGDSVKKVAVIDFGKKGVDWAIRFSPHYFNTLQEIEAVSQIVASLDRKST